MLTTIRTYFYEAIFFLPGVCIKYVSYMIRATYYNLYMSNPHLRNIIYEVVYAIDKRHRPGTDCSQLLQTTRSANRFL